MGNADQVSLNQSKSRISLDGGVCVSRSFVAELYSIRPFRNECGCFSLQLVHRIDIRQA